MVEPHLLGSWQFLWSCPLGLLSGQLPVHQAMVRRMLPSPSFTFRYDIPHGQVSFWAEPRVLTLQCSLCHPKGPPCLPSGLSSQRGRPKGPAQEERHRENPMGALPRALGSGVEYVYVYEPAACGGGWSVIMGLTIHLFFPLFSESQLRTRYGAECWERKHSHRHGITFSWTHCRMGNGRYLSCRFIMT